MNPGRGACLLALTCLAPAWGGGGGGEQPWATQLHLHGPFSGAAGSVDWHLAEAREQGVDVLFWTAEDQRLAAHHQLSTYSFDAESEPLERGEPWSADSAAEAAREKRLRAPKQAAGGGITDEHSRDGSPNLMLRRSGLGSQVFTRSFRRLVADRGLHRRPLAAGITLRLWVLPLANDFDGRGYVSCQLSEHARQRRVPARRYAVRYYLSNDEREPWRESGTLHVPVAFRAGEWNELVLELSADARSGFDFLAGDDNALTGLEFGVEARAQSEPVVHFDDLRIEQQVTGADVLALQAELLERVGRAHPGVRQYQGLELVLDGVHLGVLGGAPQLPEREHPAELVRAAHGRGALVSFNHPFGVARGPGEGELAPEALLEALAESRLLGADLLEVGYRRKGGATLAQHLWLWDRLAERGLWPVGVGVSDSLGGAEAGAAAGFVTWILAPTLEREDLLEGLRRGRAYFGDPTHFDGRMDLHWRSFRMGQIVVTDRAAVTVEFEVTGLEPGDEVLAVDAGGAGALFSAAEGDEGRVVGEHTPDRSPTFVRLEVLDVRGEVKACSNALHFVREVPPGGIPAARLGLDVGGVRTLSARGFTLTGVVARDGSVLLEGRASGGELHLELSLELTSPEVHFEGLTGDVVDLGGNLVLTGLEGQGSVRLEARLR